MDTKNMDTKNMDTKNIATKNMDTKQAVTSAATSTSTPGAVHAVHADASSMKGKRALQKTNLTSAPSYYQEDPQDPQDPQQLQLAARRLEQRAAEKSKADADAKAKSRSQRQENRWYRILSRTPQEDLQPPPSISTSRKAKTHAHKDGNMNPGVVWVPDMEDPTMVEESSTNHIDEMDETIPTPARMQAEVVEQDDGTNTRRRALLCTGIMVILLAIILGSVLGTRRDTSPDTTNDSCDNNAFGPITRAGVVSGSTSSNGATIDVQAPSCGSASKATAPAIWYTVIGDGGAIVASTCNDTDFDSQISVFTGSCDQLTCVDGNDNYCGSQSLVEFQSIQNQKYHVLVHGYGDSSGKFSLQIIFTRLYDLFVKYQVSIQALQDPSSPQYLALAWMADNDSTDLQSTLSDNELVERFALVLLYFATGGESWLEQADFLTLLDTCSWNIRFGSSGVLRVGVGCNDEGSVVMLYLASNEINETPHLPSEISLLSNLRELHLDDNLFSGSIPTEIGLLSDLVDLQLGGNQLTGRIPSELGEISTLRYVSMAFNALTGTIPSELGRISNLQYMDLYSNALTGTIPSELCLISTLKTLRLNEFGDDSEMNDNAFTGPQNLVQLRASCD